MFHMNVGVRAGGGIGDEIVDPAGDEFEVERVVFDITFFFFVVVILLAIIQGESRTLNLFYSSAWERTYHTNTFDLPCLTRIHLMNFSCGSGIRTKCLFIPPSPQVSLTHVIQRQEQPCTCIPGQQQVHTILCCWCFSFFLGLIIDAFGELRDQQEQVKEDMEVRFDTVSHIHTHTNTPPDIYHPNYMSIFCVLSRLYNVQRCFRLKLWLQTFKGWMLQ